MLNITERKTDATVLISLGIEIYCALRSTSILYQFLVYPVHCLVHSILYQFLVYIVHCLVHTVALHQFLVDIVHSLVHCSSPPVSNVHCAIPKHGGSPLM